MENIKIARNNVDGRAHADLDKRDKRYENRYACARACVWIWTSDMASYVQNKRIHVSARVNVWRYVCEL